MGRPGIEPGTLRVFPERPGTSINVQICWSDEVQCPPTSTEVRSRLTPSLDRWLGPGSFQGHVIVHCRGAHDEVFNLRLGDETIIPQTILSRHRLAPRLSSILA